MTNPIYYMDRELILGTDLAQLSIAVSAQLIRERMLNINERFVIKKMDDLGKNQVLLEGDVEKVVYN